MSNLKCIYREDVNKDPHCNMPAEYIWQGKSYCAIHLVIRSTEYEVECAEHEKLNKGDDN